MKFFLSSVTLFKMIVWLFLWKSFSLPAWGCFIAETVFMILELNKWTQYVLIYSMWDQLPYKLVLVPSIQFKAVAMTSMLFFSTSWFNTLSLLTHNSTRITHFSLLYSSMTNWVFARQIFVIFVFWCQRTLSSDWLKGLMSLFFAIACLKFERPINVFL